MAAGTVDAAAGTPAKIETKRRLGPLSPGGQRGRRLAASSPAWCSTPATRPTRAADSPEMLDVALDKPAYRAGETPASRSPRAWRPGADRRADDSASPPRRRSTCRPAAARCRSASPTTGAPAPTSRCMLYRPHGREGQAHAEPRARRCAGSAVDQAPRTLKVGLDAPEKVEVRRHADRARQGRRASPPARRRASRVAAVDVGILNLTRFEAPEPGGLVLRPAPARHRDPRPLRPPDRRHARRARQAALRRRRRRRCRLQGSPPVEETLALFSGIVKVGADGTASVDFQLPDFNGTVRVMAVAWSGDKVGSAPEDVIVRDPVALTASGPRFLTLGDQARLELAVHNVEGPAGAYTASRATTNRAPAASRSPASSAPSRSSAGERKREAFRAQARRGRPDHARRARHRPRRHRRATHAHLRRQGAGRRHQAPDGQLAGGQGRQDHASAPTCLHDLIPRRTKVIVTVGPTAAFDVPGILASLDRYPYGCAEQTTSRAMPLLYVNDVAKRIGLAHRRGAARAHRRRHRPRARDAGPLRRLRHLGAVATATCG